MWSVIKYLLAYNDSLIKKYEGSKAYSIALELHTNKDFKQAFPKMLEASELGNPSAMCLLGSMYLLGQGVKENGHQAEIWLLKSLESGYFEANSILGMAYATGKAGFKVNQTLAVELLTKAADTGDQQSQRMLELMRNGDGIFIKKPPKGSKLH